MKSFPSNHAFLGAGALAALLAAFVAGCSRSGGDHRVAGRVTGKSSDPPVTLQVQWSPTNRYIYRIETTLYNDMPARTKSLPVSQESTVGLECSLQHLRSNQDGSRQFGLEILSVQIDLTRGGELLTSYDTENHAFMLDDANIAESLQQMKGARLTCTLSPSNTVTRVDGVAALMARIGAGKAASPVRNLSFMRSASMIRSMFTEHFFKQVVEWNFFPDRPLRVGESWPARREFATNPLEGGNAVADLTCCFKGWQERDLRKCAVVDFEGKTRGASRTTRVLGIFSSSKPSLLKGRLWHHAETGVPVALACTHESSFPYASTPRSKPPANPQDTNTPPQVSTNAPTRTITLATRQCTIIELLEVAPLVK